ncbi:hypothetical protein [Streptomyces sp. NPDC088752]|uniref:hypothetical protein n=1 Tax=Streptomyces sp. NPDC088752 TaxID=3154963 RepID=UPI003424C43A
MTSPVATQGWLLPFSGAKGICPKCVSTPVFTEWHDGAVIGMCKEPREILVAFYPPGVPVPDENTEHLCRGCLRCEYTWSERIAGPDDMEKARKRGDSDHDDD